MLAARGVGRRLLTQCRRGGSDALAVVDPEMAALLQQELVRQASGLELIASENFASRHVLETLGSVATNKYAEGLPGARYYGGTEVVDEMENLTRSRCLQAYRLDPNEWGVNVQPYSGSVANFAALSSILKPHDRLMGLDLPDGGHLSHGFYTAKKKVSNSSIYFESFAYKLAPNGYVDYDALEAVSARYLPKVIIAGGSAYPREWDYPRLRSICDKIGAYLLMDMAHISGLIATQHAEDPFKVADLVTSTTHKTLRGPRAGLIFWRKSKVAAGAVDEAVFPGLQGGPHMNQIAAIGAQMKEVMSPQFRGYTAQVVANAKALAKELIRLGYTLVSGGTDNHLLLMDMRPKGLTGSKVQVIMDAVAITLNKNSIVGDKSAMNPGGIRLGTPALTSRGFVEADFIQVAQFLDRAITTALALQEKSGKKLVDFQKAVDESPEVRAIKADVEKWARTFPFPGLENAYPLETASKA
ncbi:Serine hydroxymethyltransferase 2 [Diplonema papillatum]|nr:Serine hydroxymethyltransferase 2 [Diplonema papillatum]